MIFSHRFRKLHILWLLAALFLFCTAAAGTEKGSEPISIEADRMISQENDNSVIFLGNVDARQGDLLIRTDKMVVYYVQEEGSGPATKNSSEVKKLVCTGNVQISQGDWLGTGSKMDYYAEDRKVILSGNARAWQGQNTVAGKSITYFLDEGRSIVEGPSTAEGSGGKGGGSKPGRVKAVIKPGSGD